MTDQTDDNSPDSAGTAGEAELIAAERLIFFSDAVVAIAITLLALGLPLPSGSGDEAVWLSLRSHSSAYLAFLISFAVIGAHWRLHHRLYRYVGRLDPRLISINMLWLLTIILTPYVTRVLEGPDAFGVRFSLYAAIQVITMVTFVLMRRHVRDHDLLRPGATANVVASDDINFIGVAAAFAISIPVAAVSGSQLTFLIWVAAAFGARAFRRLRDPLGQRG
jgi:TMEM175 potassium channel family protein